MRTFVTVIVCPFKYARFSALVLKTQHVRSPSNMFVVFVFIVKEIKKFPETVCFEYAWFASTFSRDLNRVR